MTSRRTIMQLAAGLVVPSIFESPFTSGVLAQQVATTVPMYRGNPARTGAMPGPAPTLEESIGVQWRFTPSAGGATTPTYANGTVYSPGADGILYALNGNTGQIKNQFQAETAITSAPTIDADMLYVGTADGSIRALNSTTGEESWSVFITNVNPLPAPLLYNDTIFTGGEGEFIAVDAANGAEVWRYAQPNQIFATPAIADGILCFSSMNLFALDADTGEELWQFPDANGVPVIVDGVVYAGGYGGGLFALDAATGEVMWQIETGPWSDFPTVRDGVVYIGSEEPSLLAVDAATGGEIWKLPSETHSWNGPAIADGFLYVVNSYRADEGYADFLCIDATTGEIPWSIHLDRGYISDAIVADGSVFVSIGGTLTAISNIPSDQLTTNEYELIYTPEN